MSKKQIFVYTKRKGISSNDILETLEGKPLVKGKFGLPMQNAKQFINNLGQFATNQELRLQDFITPQQSANLEGGKDSKILYSLNTKGNGKWVQNPLIIYNLQRSKLKSNAYTLYALTLYVLRC